MALRNRCMGAEKSEVNVSPFLSLAVGCEVDQDLLSDKVLWVLSVALQVLEE